MPRQRLQALLAALRKQLPRLTNDYGVESLGVFGSYVRSEERADSDLDLLVSFRRPIGLIRFLGLENELSDRLGVKIDLVPRDALRPKVAEQVLREVVAISADPVLRSLAVAPLDDEPDDDDFDGGLVEARREVAEGRALSHAEMLAAGILMQS